ncbi:MAG: GNAT family N-acetyltransferase, partial [Woeseia sp.]
GKLYWMANIVAEPPSGNGPRFPLYIAEIDESATAVVRDSLVLVDDRAEGNGIGRALLSEAEQAARQRGAQSMSLNVISTNSRARRFYERSGYDGELIRYIKRIGT